VQEQKWASRRGLPAAASSQHQQNIKDGINYHDDSALLIKRLNDSILRDVVMVTKNVTNQIIAKHFEWLLHWSQYLQNHTQKFKAENHSKNFKNNSNCKQP